MIYYMLGLVLIAVTFMLLGFRYLATQPRQLVNCPSPHDVCLAVTATLEKELDILGALTDDEFDRRVEEAVQASLPPPPPPELVPFDPERVKAAVNRVRNAAAQRAELERLAEYHAQMARLGFPSFEYRSF